MPSDSEMLVDKGSAQFYTTHDQLENETSTKLVYLEKEVNYKVDTNTDIINNNGYKFDEFNPDSLTKFKFHTPGVYHGRMENEEEKIINLLVLPLPEDHYELVQVNTLIRNEETEPQNGAESCNCLKKCSSGISIPSVGKMIDERVVDVDDDFEIHDVDVTSVEHDYMEYKVEKNYCVRFKVFEEDTFELTSNTSDSQRLIAHEEIVGEYKLKCFQFRTNGSYTFSVGSRVYGVIDVMEEKCQMNINEKNEILMEDADLGIYYTDDGSIPREPLQKLRRLNSNQIFESFKTYRFRAFSSYRLPSNIINRRCDKRFMLKSQHMSSRENIGTFFSYIDKKTDQIFLFLYPNINFITCKFIVNSKLYECPIGMVKETRKIAYEINLPRHSTNLDASTRNRLITIRPLFEVENDESKRKEYYVHHKNVCLINPPTSSQDEVVINGPFQTYTIKDTELHIDITSFSLGDLMQYCWYDKLILEFEDPAGVEELERHELFHESFDCKIDFQPSNTSLNILESLDYKRKRFKLHKIEPSSKINYHDYILTKNKLWYKDFPIIRFNSQIDNKTSSKLLLANERDGEFSESQIFEVNVIKELDKRIYCLTVPDVRINLSCYNNDGHWIIKWKIIDLPFDAIVLRLMDNEGYKKENTMVDKNEQFQIIGWNEKNDLKIDLFLEEKGNKFIQKSIIVQPKIIFDYRNLNLRYDAEDYPDIKLIWDPPRNIVKKDYEVYLVNRHHNFKKHLTNWTSENGGGMKTFKINELIGEDRTSSEFAIGIQPHRLIVHYNYYKFNLNQKINQTNYIKLHRYKKIELSKKPYFTYLSNNSAEIDWERIHSEDCVGYLIIWNTYYGRYVDSPQITTLKIYLSQMDRNGTNPANHLFQIIPMNKLAERFLDKTQKSEIRYQLTKLMDRGLFLMKLDNYQCKISEKVSGNLSETFPRHIHEIVSYRGNKVIVKWLDIDGNFDSNLQYKNNNVDVSEELRESNFKFDLNEFPRRTLDYRLNTKFVRKFNNHQQFGMEYFYNKSIELLVTKLWVISTLSSLRIHFDMRDLNERKIKMCFFHLSKDGENEFDAYKPFYKAQPSSPVTFEKLIINTSYKLEILFVKEQHSSSIDDHETNLKRHPRKYLRQLGKDYNVIKYESDPPVWMTAQPANPNIFSYNYVRERNVFSFKFYGHNSNDVGIINVIYRLYWKYDYEDEGIEHYVDNYSNRNDGIYSFEIGCIDIRYPVWIHIRSTIELAEKSLELTSDKGKFLLWKKMLPKINGHERIQLSRITPQHLTFTWLLPSLYIGDIVYKIVKMEFVYNHNKIQIEDINDNEIKVERNETVHIVLNIYVQPSVSAKDEPIIDDSEIISWNFDAVIPKSNELDRLSMNLNDDEWSLEQTRKGTKHKVYVVKRNGLEEVTAGKGEKVHLDDILQINYRNSLAYHVFLIKFYCQINEIIQVIGCYWTNYFEKIQLRAKHMNKRKIKFFWNYPQLSREFNQFILTSSNVNREIEKNRTNFKQERNDFLDDNSTFNSTHISVLPDSFTRHEDGEQNRYYLSNFIMNRTIESDSKHLKMKLLSPNEVLLSWKADKYRNIRWICDGFVQFIEISNDNIDNCLMGIKPNTFIEVKLDEENIIQYQYNLPKLKLFGIASGKDSVELQWEHMSKDLMLEKFLYDQKTNKLIKVGNDIFVKENRHEVKELTPNIWGFRLINKETGDKSRKLKINLKIFNLKFGINENNQIAQYTSISSEMHKNLVSAQLIGKKKGREKVLVERVNLRRMSPFYQIEKIDDLVTYLVRIRFLDIKHIVEYEVEKYKDVLEVYADFDWKLFDKLRKLIVYSIKLSQSIGKYTLMGPDKLSDIIEKNELLKKNSYREYYEKKKKINVKLTMKYAESSQWTFIKIRNQIFNNPAPSFCEEECIELPLNEGVKDDKNCLIAVNEETDVPDRLEVGVTVRKAGNRQAHRTLKFEDKPFPFCILHNDKTSLCKHVVHDHLYIINKLCYEDKTELVDYGKCFEKQFANIKNGDILFVYSKICSASRMIEEFVDKLNKFPVRKFEWELYKNIRLISNQQAKRSNAQNEQDKNTDNKEEQNIEEMFKVPMFQEFITQLPAFVFINNVDENVNLTIRYLYAMEQKELENMLNEGSMKSKISHLNLRQSFDDLNSQYRNVMGQLKSSYKWNNELVKYFQMYTT
ncbi:hypothetical protein SNEBB_009660 [Seison nebaliae]|nr:hypothetical protein SNEBB_009660 [Seison nebaliae]